VFAPASTDRARIVPATRAAAANPASPHGAASAADCSPNLTWAQRLKRVFGIDLETCRQCGGRLRVIASIEQPALIERILGHLGRAAGSGSARSVARDLPSAPLLQLASTGSAANIEPLVRPIRQLFVSLACPLIRASAPIPNSRNC
jgi:hypothetical protein